MQKPVDELLGFQCLASCCHLFLFICCYDLLSCTELGKKSVENKMHVMPRVLKGLRKEIASTTITNIARKTLKQAALTLVEINSMLRSFKDSVLGYK